MTHDGPPLTASPEIRMPSLGTLFGRFPEHARKPPLVLINGLAEQAETWFRNLPAWRRHFEVLMPNIMAFEGQAFHERIHRGEPISIDFLVEQLHSYLHNFVQTPPYFVGGSSTGGKIAVELALRYPNEVSRVVLFGPSGLSDEERLPVVQGVRRSDARAMVDSVFFNRRLADRGLLRYYKECMARRRWKIGFLRAVRGTLDFSIREKLLQLRQPTLLLMGKEDRIVDPVQAREAALKAKNVRYIEIPKCGHAPHQEKPRFVNRSVVRFLREGAKSPPAVRSRS
jgi:pimeloyl-ACP methyl ester carboxylesterase